MTAGAEL